ncbi:hypothetical protein TWF481_003192 [Arthrobotrys musiformis]|uniref:BTB domain-containing protein n=1 Tax=Arthrobotrys musiformis TaxID=47236 RepID=A0AAV9VRQ4_9PEZI
MSGWNHHHEVREVGHPKRVSFDLSHSRSIPHPPPTPQAAEREVEITFGKEDGQRTFRAREGELCRVPYFLSRIAQIRYGLPDHSIINFKYDNIDPDAGCQVLNWLQGKRVHACVMDNLTTSLEYRIGHMYEAAVEFHLGDLRSQILKICRDKIRCRDIDEVRYFTKMMTHMYAVAPEEDQDDISDTINSAVKHIPISKWWDGIKADPDDTGFYHRVAGIVFRNLDALVCRRCALGDDPKYEGCIICGSAL